ncbi:MAG: transporter substrate-binding domain-containing protein [Zoogloeaceae bacterium]|nr:transporter substrate-binding domain-containing protein [Zoogloeaceae bacterium]
MFRFTLTVFSMVLAASACAAEVVRLATHDLPPYGSYRGGNERFTGVAVDVVDCVMKRVSRPYQLLVVPWARAQRLVQTGEADGFFAASQNPERDAYAVRTLPIAPQEWRWYLLASNKADPLSAEFRQTGSVGSFLGANMLDWLNRNGYKVEASPATTERLLQMLQLGRVDAILANHLVMDRLLREHKLEKSVRSVLQESKPLSVYFSKSFLAGSPGFLEAFNAQIEPCRAKGNE